MRDEINDTRFARTLSEIVEDVTILFRQEMQLAKAELSENVSDQLRSLLLHLAAGILGFIAILLICQAAVFALASYGLAPHWACLVVAGIALALAAIAYVSARSQGSQRPILNRTVHQFRQDIATAKETMS